MSNLREYLHKKKDIAPDDRAEVEGWISEMTLLPPAGFNPDTGSEPGPGRLASDGSRRRAFAASGPGRDAGRYRPPTTRRRKLRPPDRLPRRRLTWARPMRGRKCPPPAESGSQDGRKTAIWVLAG